MFLKRLFDRKNEAGISLTKVGTLIAGIAGAILAADVTPDNVDKILQIIIVVGGVLAGNGIRDAVGRMKS